MGVFHHLASPEAGLAALASVLNADGVMGVMLYARYGRESVYQIQNLMKIVNKDETNMQRKIDNCKAVLKHLPATNAFSDLRHSLREVETFGDVGIYDLLLHSHDVAYAIPDVYTFLGTSGLELTHLFFNEYGDVGNDLYRLESYFKDPNLAKLIGALSIPEKRAAAELMHGKIMKHTFYASRRKPTLPSINDMDNVPYFSMMIQREAYKQIRDTFKTCGVGHELSFKAYGTHIRCVKTPHADGCLAALDGEKSIGEICREVRSSYPVHKNRPSIKDLQKEMGLLFSAFNKCDWMFLRDKAVPGCKTMHEIQHRVTSAWR
jgi:hypothetical protein